MAFNGRGPPARLSVRPPNPERRLCVAVGLASAAMAIITGTVIVLILSNVSPVIRVWPASAGSWDSSGDLHITPDWKLGDGYSHARCQFDTSDYKVTVSGDDAGGSSRYPPDRYFTPAAPTDDEELGPGLEDVLPEDNLPADNPTIEDEFSDDGKEPDVDNGGGVGSEDADAGAGTGIVEDDYFDNGLAVIRVDQAPPNTPVLSGWDERDGSAGIVKNIPPSSKPPPRNPFPRLSKMKATLIAWNETSSSFESHDSLTAYDELNSAGFFGSAGDPKPLVLITHGWHGAVDDSKFLLGGTRLYSRAVPDAAVLYLDWDQQGAKRTAANATMYAWRVNVTRFVEKLAKTTDLHCVGHSIGAFACAAVCRQFYAAAGKTCSRLVAISPYEILDLVPELTQRVHDRVYRKDADYVVTLASNTRGMAADEKQADEYVIFNNLAATSEVCEAEDDWGLDICASNGTGASRSCELLGVHNVTFVTPPTDKKRYCASMLPPTYFFAASDAERGGVPMIRSNPMASSTLVGVLPSVWDSRVYSKDYRFSSFVRNDSVWYWANYGQNDTSINATHVFTLVVPYVSNAAILSSTYTAKTRYHNISVYSSFVRGSNNEPEPELVTVLTPGPVLSAYMWTAGGSANFNTSFKDGMTVPISAQRFTKYLCSQDGAHYLCIRTAVKSVVPAIRRRLPTDGLSVPVPMDGCFPYTPPNVQLVVWKRRGLRLPVGKNVTVTYSHSRQLMAVVLENHEVPGNSTLLSFYDSCGVAAKSGLYFEYDWTKAQMTAAFIVPGRYTMRWYFLFEVLEVPVTAYDGTRSAGYPFDSTSWNYRL